MLILSIDQSMACSGYVLFNGDNTIRTGTVPTKHKKSDPMNINRLRLIYNSFDLIYKTFKPDLVVIERFFVNNMRGAQAVGEVRAILKLLAAKYQIPMKEYSPQEVRKSIANNGRADKEDIARIVLDLYPHLRDQNLSLDETDALGMALHAMKVENNVTSETSSQTTISKKKKRSKTTSKTTRKKNTIAKEGQD